MILVIDTAKVEAFLGLWESSWLAEARWEAGRNLSADILIKLSGIYEEVGRELSDTTKIIVSAGPGSFTGLRIGLSVANTLAYVCDIPIVGVPGTDDQNELVNKGLEMLTKKEKFAGSVIPVYGAEPNITKPKVR